MPVHVQAGLVQFVGIRSRICVLVGSDFRFESRRTGEVPLPQLLLYALQSYPAPRHPTRSHSILAFQKETPPAPTTSRSSSPYHVPPAVGDRGASIPRSLIASSTFTGARSSEVAQLGPGEDISYAACTVRTVICF